MKIVYQLTLEYEMSEDDLLGDTPSEFITKSMEEDPAMFLDASTITKVQLKKVIKGESKALDEDDSDDDDLTILDEEELENE